MTKTIDDLRPGDRVRFEHEDGNVIVGEVKRLTSGAYQVKGSVFAFAVATLTLQGFTLAHVEPAAPSLPEEPPVGSVVRWKDDLGQVGIATRRGDRLTDPWSADTGPCSWGDIVLQALAGARGTAPELLVSRTELVNEIADWLDECGYGSAPVVRERFLP